MALRISPYLLSLIDWNDPHDDPIRTQFLPWLLSNCPTIQNFGSILWVNSRTRPFPA